MMKLCGMTWSRPRLALSNQLDTLAGMDGILKTGVECEFMLLDAAGVSIADSMDLVRQS